MASIHPNLYTSRPITRRAPKISDFPGDRFNVHCHCIIAVLLWSILSKYYIFNYYITMCPGRDKHRKLYIWSNIPELRGHLTKENPNQVSRLPMRFMRLCASVYFLVYFPLSDERTCVTRQGNSIAAGGESFLMAQPSHIWWGVKDCSKYIIHSLCSIKTPCLHSLNGHYPYCLSYPCPCWDDGTYGYPSLIRQGHLSHRPFCGHSSVPEINLRGLSIGRTINVSYEKHKLTVFSMLCLSVACFVTWIQ